LPLKLNVRCSMQLNAALSMLQFRSGVATLPRRFLLRAVGLTSFGVRRTRIGVPRSTAAVCAGRPSFGGRRKVQAGSRFGVVSGKVLLHSSRCLPRLQRAACPSAVSVRSCRAQAPRSTVRCSSAAAFGARWGRSQSRSVVLPLASCKTGCHSSIVAGTLTVTNAVPAKRGSSSGGGVRARSSGTAVPDQAPNPSVKRTAPGVPGSAAYLKRWVLQERMRMPRYHGSEPERFARGCR
jgi:hypothetical protein